MVYSETYGAKAQIVENSVLIVLVPISRPSDKISGGSLFFRIIGVWSLPATGNRALNHCLCSSFYSFKDILILFVAISMYFRSGKTLSMFVFTLGYNLSQKFGKM